MLHYYSLAALLFACPLELLCSLRSRLILIYKSRNPPTLPAFIRSCYYSLTVHESLGATAGAKGGSHLFANPVICLAVDTVPILPKQAPRAASGDEGSSALCKWQRGSWGDGSEHGDCQFNSITIQCYYHSQCFMLARNISDRFVDRSFRRQGKKSQLSEYDFSLKKVVRVPSPMVSAT